MLRARPTGSRPNGRRPARGARRAQSKLFHSFVAIRADSFRIGAERRAELFEMGGAMANGTEEAKYGVAQSLSKLVGYYAEAPSWQL